MYVIGYRGILSSWSPPFSYSYFILFYFILFSYSLSLFPTHISVGSKAAGKHKRGNALHRHFIGTSGPKDRVREKGSGRWLKECAVCRLGQNNVELVINHLMRVISGIDSRRE